MLRSKFLFRNISNNCSYNDVEMFYKGVSVKKFNRYKTLIPYNILI